MELDFLSITVATIISIFFVIFYYSDLLFGEIWREEVGITNSDLQVIKKNLPLTLATFFVLNFCIAVVLEFLFLQLGIVTVKEVVFYVMIFWVGFFGVTTLANNLIEGRSFRLFIIKTLYQFLNFLLIGTFLVLI